MTSRFGGPEDVQGVVRDLLLIMHETSLQRTISVGRLVLDRFFDGSAQLWHDRRRNKNNSVRRLAAAPDCPLSRSALNQAIGVYTVLQMLPSANSFRHVAVSHITAVLSLSIPEQERWLRLADAEHWSVRRLREEILRYRRQRGERRGRPRSSSVAKALTRVRRSAKSLERSIERLRDVELDHAPEATLLELAAQLTGLKSKLATLLSQQPSPSATRRAAERWHRA